MEFLIGGLAAVGAGFFTNPLEVLKTRLQLQGELQAKGEHAVHYKNVFHTAYVVARNDGVFALQKGLVPALWVQLCLNGVRFGVYDLADNAGYLRDGQGNLIFIKNVLITGAGAVTGQYLSSPFYLVKTHLQSQAVSNIAVGHQHNHEGSFRALKNIFVAKGVKGIFQGAVASIPRSFVGGSSQLMSFEYSKQFVESYNITHRPILKLFIASMVGGVAITLAMTPFDLILTRLCNQPTDANGKGIMYKNYLDCVYKIYKSEGVLAFYKGVGPNYLRLGPHTVLCLVFWDNLRSLHNKYFVNKDVSTKNI